MKWYALKHQAMIFCVTIILWKTYQLFWKEKELGIVFNLQRKKNKQWTKQSEKMIMN